MSINAIREAIETRFKDNWTGTDANTEVRYSNAPFAKPEDTDWASIDIRWVKALNSEISQNLTVRRRGIIVIELYSPIDQGTGTLASLAQEAIDIFENEAFAVTGDAINTSVQCFAADLRHDGVPNIQGTDPQWYKYSVRIVFHRDE